MDLKCKKMNLVNTMRLIKQYLYMLLLIGFLVVMLCFPMETFHGATNGLLLWFQTLLPTLLPFMILSNLLIRTNCVFYISRTIRPFIQKLFHVSNDACYAVLIGFLCCKLTGMQGEKKRKKAGGLSFFFQGVCLLNLILQSFQGFFGICMSLVGSFLVPLY